MAVYKYAIQTIESGAKASGRSIDVSPKQCIEICNYVRGRPVTQAKMLLEQSINMIKPIPFKRFTNGVGHKPGMASGRYVPKACAEVLKVIQSAESNAKNKGLNADSLVVVHIATQRGPKSAHYGRQRRSVTRTVHIEVAVAEVVQEKTEKSEKAKKSEKIKKSSEKKEAKSVKEQKE